MAQGFEERFSASYADILKLARARLSRERATVSTVTLARLIPGTPPIRFLSGKFAHFEPAASRKPWFPAKR